MILFIDSTEVTDVFEENLAVLCSINSLKYVKITIFHGLNRAIRHKYTGKNYII